MAIDAASVKELRERTGAGMMDCKRALQEASGDLDQAAELLRKAGQAKADKKAARVAAEGQIVIRGGAGRHVMLEINSETDFVAKDENFLKFADSIAAAALRHAPADLSALMALTHEGQSLETLRQALVAKVGENIAVRRYHLLETQATVAAYSHMGRIGVLVEIDGGDETLARDLAMHVAASAPRYLDASQMPAAELDKEREILTAQALGQGKAEDIVKRMVEGQLRKFVDNVTLLGQPFVKDADKRVRELLAAAKATVKSFLRYEVGEGIEKKTDDFAQEVMAQASRSR
ncbi:MAG TPA: translation elongation factor Ts [Gammaproteobacteria bacterium]|jgi:elongation factor Ts